MSLIYNSGRRDHRNDGTFLNPGLSVSGSDNRGDSIFNRYNSRVGSKPPLLHDKRPGFGYQGEVVCLCGVGNQDVPLLN